MDHASAHAGFPRVKTISGMPGSQKWTGHTLNFEVVAVSEPPSVTTWLENARSEIAFSEPPSVSTWLENARSGRIFRAAKCFHLA